jgi:hypothetical protein
LAFAVVAYRLLSAGCRVFAACSPPGGRHVRFFVTIPRRGRKILRMLVLAVGRWDAKALRRKALYEEGPGVKG